MWNECDLCGAVERRRDLALYNVTIVRVGTGGHPDNPQCADICAGCLNKPISMLADFFWREEVAEMEAALVADRNPGQ